MRLAQGGVLALIFFGALAMLSEPARAMDSACDGAQVSQSNVNSKNHCVRPGSGMTEWFKDCEACPEMVVIPAGNFMMGSGKANDEKPVHRVTISKPFAVGKYAVTRGEFAAFINDSSYKIEGNCLAVSLSSPNQITVKQNNSWHSPGFEQGDRDPAVCVNWRDAAEYVDWLSKKTGKAYRLLTEAEYEYAARAGTTTSYFWGEDIGKNRANCGGCGSQWDWKRTAPIGSFANNAFGLHEVLGNAHSWVEDCYHENYSNAPVDGSEWTIGGDCSMIRFRNTELGPAPFTTGRWVVRGGSWRSPPKGLRAAARLAFERLFRVNYIGIRVARTIAP
jgi:formylglycine-generating enzyme required for sulfatase activity